VSSLSFSLINGDINGDNAISLADFGGLKLAYGSTPSSGNWNPNADLDGNGSVGLGDFGVFHASGQERHPLLQPSARVLRLSHHALRTNHGAARSAASSHADAPSVRAGTGGNFGNVESDGRFRHHHLAK